MNARVIKQINNTKNINSIVMANLYSPAESLSLNNENSILQYVLKRTFFFLFLNLWRKRSTSQGKPKVLIILTRKFPAKKILISNPFSTMTKYLGILESLSKIATWIKCLGFYVAKKRLDYTTGNLQSSTQFYLVYPGKAANNLSLLKGHIPG